MTPETLSFPKSDEVISARVEIRKGHCPLLTLKNCTDATLYNVTFTAGSFSPLNGILCVGDFKPFREYDIDCNGPFDENGLLEMEYSATPSGQKVPLTIYV